LISWQGGWVVVQVPVLAQVPVWALKLFEALQLVVTLVWLVA
tara:strand:- start:50 stop:175 length:126 start_codon:yes stop_codon:yes gene_type:complete